MKYAMKIELKLLEAGFHFDGADDILAGERFFLGGGAVSTIYDNGTVMVQGKLSAFAVRCFLFIKQWLCITSNTNAGNRDSLFRRTGQRSYRNPIRLR